MCLKTITDALSKHYNKTAHSVVDVFYSIPIRYKKYIYSHAEQRKSVVTGGVIVECKANETSIYTTQKAQ
jgi:predicted NodU family carbamoyl transferase